MAILAILALQNGTVAVSKQGKAHKFKAKSSKLHFTSLLYMRAWPLKKMCEKVQKVQIGLPRPKGCTLALLF
jgi:hypothetical protein